MLLGSALEYRLFQFHDELRTVYDAHKLRDAINELKDIIRDFDSREQSNEAAVTPADLMSLSIEDTDIASISSYLDGIRSYIKRIGPTGRAQVNQ